MIGQKKILSKLNSSTYDGFPNSLILVGEIGCGKHTLCDELHNKYPDFNMMYVSDKMNYDFVESCYLNVTPTFYVIDADKLSVREQNVILKLFEEPPQNVKIILLASDTGGLLNTITNRATIWEFEKYSDGELRQFLSDGDDTVLKYARTPGQVKTMTSDKLHKMVDLAQLMIDKIDKAYVPNVLSIGDKFDFKELSGDKFNVNVFIKVLKRVIVHNMETERLMDTKHNLVGAYFVACTYADTLHIQNINKRYSFDKFLLDFKKVIVC